MSNRQAVHWKGRSCGGERSSFANRTQRVCGGSMQQTVKEKISCKHKAAGRTPFFLRLHASAMKKKMPRLANVFLDVGIFGGELRRRRRRSQSEQGDNFVISQFECQGIGVKAEVKEERKD